LCLGFKMARPDGAARGDTPRRRPIVSGLGQVKSRAFVQVRELPSTLMYPRGGVVHADLPAFDGWSPLMFPRRVCCAPVYPHRGRMVHADLPAHLSTRLSPFAARPTVSTSRMARPHICADLPAPHDPPVARCADLPAPGMDATAPIVWITGMLCTLKLSLQYCVRRLGHADAPALERDADLPAPSRGFPQFNDVCDDAVTLSRASADTAVHADLVALGRADLGAAAPQSLQVRPDKSAVPCSCFSL